VAIAQAESDRGVTLLLPVGYYFITPGVCQVAKFLDIIPHPRYNQCSWLCNQPYWLRRPGMFKAIFGSEKKGKILLFIYAHGESYPTEIARVFGYHLNAVQNQLLNLEKDGILFSKLKGRVRLFGINPRYPFKEELGALFEKILQFIPPQEKRNIYISRLRPRVTGKSI
jgi:hypothetical protein